MTQCYGDKLVRSLWLIPLFVTWLCLPARAASDAQDKPDAAGLPAPAGDVRPGGQVDVAPFAYAYRKGATDNPVETRWLNPTADILCGVLWEERRAVRRIEVEFPSTAVPRAEQLRLVTRAAAAPLEEASAPGFGLGPQPEFTLKPVGAPAVTKQGTTVFTFASENDINSIKVLYSGSDPKIGVPTVRAFGRSNWKAPLTVEIQWAYQPEQATQRVPGRWDGRIAAYNGYVGRVAPLSDKCGVTAVGEHAWKDGPAAAGAPACGSRGIKLPIFQTDGEINSRTVVTLWTAAGDFSFAPRDLESGPILIPSLGVFITTAANGATPATFQAELAARGLRTVRQRVRAAPEESWASRHEALPRRRRAERFSPAALRTIDADRRAREATGRPVALGSMAPEALVAETARRQLLRQHLAAGWHGTDGDRAGIVDQHPGAGHDRARRRSPKAD